MTRAQSEYEQKQAVRSYMAELNSALQNGRYKYFADLRQRVQRKEPGAQEEVNAVDAELLTRWAGTAPPGSTPKLTTCA